MLNKVTLIGYVGSDPELRYTTDGTPVSQFNLATSKSWKDKNGTKHDSTSWHKIVAWRKLAEIIGEYIRKGSLLYVEGELVIREYEDRDGNKRKTHEIVINDMKMLGGKDKNGSSSGSSNRSSGQKSAGSSGGQYGGSRDDDFVREEDYSDETPL